MHCPYCHADESKVTDSRNSSDTNSIKRRRECLSCGKRFTTFETVDLTLQVHKRDGRFEDFQQDKLVRGLDEACRHTRVSHEQVLKIAYEVTKELMESQVKEIKTMELGAIAMRKLQHLDPVAYIRFACVYRRFKDVDELIDAIQTSTLEEGITHAT